MALSAPQMAGDQLNPVDIEGHTLVVCPIEFKEHVPTIHTKPGEQSPCIVVNVADLAAVGGVPVVYRGVMWFNTMLVNGLKRQIGETILGRMQKGQGTPGKNPPWQLIDVMTEGAWVEYAENWLKTNEGQEFEVEAIRAANAAPQPAAPVAAAPAPVAPPAPPAAPPVTQAPPPAVAAPPAAPPAPVAAPAADPMAALMALPEAERAKLLAILGAQGQAAH